MASSSSSSAGADAPGKCPVDHSSLPPTTKSASDACPVDHTTRSTWDRFLSPDRPRHPTPSASADSSSSSLSTDREVSSIPKPNDGNWVYPSEAQFFAAMARKNHNPQAADMKTIIPIHNAVNERAWSEILKWERGKGGDACGGVQLVNFKGRPNDRTPKARLNELLGYAAPFDRHDWVVDRCGTRLRYVIDFYSGSASSSQGGNISFYLDVRPALDSWEGVKMRLERWLPWS